MPRPRFHTFLAWHLSIRAGDTILPRERIKFPRFHTAPAGITADPPLLSRLSIPCFFRAGGVRFATVSLCALFAFYGILNAAAIPAFPISHAPTQPGRPDGGGVLLNALNDFLHSVHFAGAAKNNHTKKLRTNSVHVLDNNRSVIFRGIPTSQFRFLL